MSTPAAALVAVMVTSTTQDAAGNLLPKGKIIDLAGPAARQLIATGRGRLATAAEIEEAGKASKAPKAPKVKPKAEASPAAEPEPEQQAEMPMEQQE